MCGALVVLDPWMMRRGTVVEAKPRCLMSGRAGQHSEQRQSQPSIRGGRTAIGRLARHQGAGAGAEAKGRIQGFDPNLPLLRSWALLDCYYCSTFHVRFR